MVSSRHVTAASRVVAALVFAPLLVGAFGAVLPPAGIDALGTLVPPLSLPDRAGTLYLTGLPTLLGAVLLVRAFVTREPVDVVLAAFSVPCLVGGPWTMYRTAVAPPEGVVWFPILVPVAGLLLAAFVLFDGVLDLRDSIRAGRPTPGR